MEILNLGDEITIYKGKLKYDKINLIAELLINIEINANTFINDESPGIQSAIIIKGINIDKLINSAIDKLKNQFNLDSDELCLLESWVYQSKNDNKKSIYHNHMHNGTNKHIYTLQNDWTIIFYVQMPNNLNGDDGYIHFKSKKGIKYSFLPEEGDFLIIPADLEHRPALSINSTLDRFVIGINYMRLDVNKKYRKLEKSLF
jgi:hypothetical protein